MLSSKIPETLDCRPFMCTSAKNFSFFVEKENDSAPFRVIHHHIEFALPFFGRKFLVADQENNGLALILLIDECGRELQFGGRAIAGERSFGGAGGQISDSSSAVGGGKRG